MAISESTPPVSAAKSRTSFGILGAISLSHLLNDMIQSLILAIYPLLQSEFSLTFVQIGMITLTFQLASSLLQPVVGYWTDKYPMPWSLPIGMCFTLSGLILLAMAGSFEGVLVAAALVGTGSSVFHPESSRVARMASGGRHGLAQSLFQVGGNFGSSLGPLLAAVIIAPYGKGNVAWFVLAALLAIVVLAQISRWYAAQHKVNKGKPKAPVINPLPRNKVILAVSILLMLIFSKYFYMASISSYYTFYLMEKFGLSVQNAQFHLFAFLFAVAAGTFIGGPLGDKIGRKYVIWGLYPRRSAFHPYFTLRKSVVDGCFNRDHWFYPRLGVFGHPGVCPGAASGTYRHGFRAVFWFCLRDGRPWRGGIRADCRPYQHLFGLQNLCFPATSWDVDHIPA